LAGLVVLAALGGPAPAQVERELTTSEQALLGPPAGRALAGAELAARTEAVAGLMRCPVCQGLSVADSHTLAAAAIRGKIERLLAAGYSEAQVLAYFEASYGEFIRLSPRAEGFNVVVWVAPILMLLAGALVVAARLRRARGASRDQAELEALRERVRQETAS
jgi:cytochrome c-type biogenesis protein CcmH